MEYYNILNQEYFNTLKNNIVQLCFKVELMDYDENVLQEITQDISKEDSGSLSVNYQQGVRRSCSITLLNNFGNYIPTPETNIWMNTKFKLYIGVKRNNLFQYFNKAVEVEGNNPVFYRQDTVDPLNYQDSLYRKKEDIYWFSQGVFILTNPQVLRDKSKKIVTLTGVDKFGIFGAETNFHETDGTYMMPAGTKVGELITDILGMDIGNGHKIDPKVPYIDSSIRDSSLPYDIKKSPNSYFGDILIELGNVFACDIFYDNDGVLNFVKGEEESALELREPIWRYSDVFPDYFSPKAEYDFKNVYNVIKVVGNNAAAENLYSSTVKNTDLSSPTNIYQVGEKIKYVESSFCYNQDRTDDFAKYLLRKYSIVQNLISFQSTIIPHLEVNNIISITDRYFHYDNKNFIIQSLTFPLNVNSLMTIKASNLANIPYFEY